MVSEYFRKIDLLLPATHDVKHLLVWIHMPKTIHKTMSSDNIGVGSLKPTEQVKLYLTFNVNFTEVHAGNPRYTYGLGS